MRCSSAGGAQPCRQILLATTACWVSWPGERIQSISPAIWREGGKGMQVFGPDSSPGAGRCGDEQGSTCWFGACALAKHVLCSAGGWGVHLQ